MRSFIVALVCLLGLALAHSHKASEGPVTCGSAIKLQHEKTGYRLHSHEIAYGSGSRQQSVTGYQGGDDPNSLWTVRSEFGRICERGAPIACGSIVRLQHLKTKKWLHSHDFQSPLSGQQEISAFGDGGASDTGDNWALECESETWMRGGPVRFKHVDTGKYLHSHNKRYNNPIAGQQEVTGYNRRTANTVWQSAEGFFFKDDE